MQVKILKLRPDAVLPTYESENASGCDLRACLSGRPVPEYIKPGKTVLVPTGIALELPTGWEAQIRPRSGLAMKHSVTVANTPGTIDADYRGEISVILINLGERAFRLQHGMRVAQLVVTPVLQVEWQEVRELSDTARGEQGFGSTGL